jgi:hypothetical protein
MRNLYTYLHFVTENPKSIAAFYSAASALSPLGELDLECTFQFVKSTLGLLTSM